MLHLSPRVAIALTTKTAEFDDNNVRNTRFRVRVYLLLPIPSYFVMEYNVYSSSQITSRSELRLLRNRTTLRWGVH